MLMIDYIIGSNCGRSAWLRRVVAGCTFVSHFATRRMLPRATSWSSSNRDQTRWRGLWMTGLKKLSFQIREDLLSISAWANWQAIFFCHTLISGICQKQCCEPMNFLDPAVSLEHIGSPVAHHPIMDNHGPRKWIGKESNFGNSSSF